MLSISDKLNYKDEFDKYDVNIFLNMMIQTLSSEYKMNNDKKIFDMYMTTLKYTKMLRDRRLNKRYIIEKYLSDLWKEGKKCMNIIELKNKIEDKTLDDSFLVLQYSDVSFIARQYVEEISNFKNRPIVYVDSLDSIAESIFGDDGMLYVMNTDKITTSN